MSLKTQVFVCICYSKGYVECKLLYYGHMSDEELYRASGGTLIITDKYPLCQTLKAQSLRILKLADHNKWLRKILFPPSVPESVSLWLRQLEYWERGITPLSPQCYLRQLVTLHHDCQKDVLQLFALIFHEEHSCTRRVAAIAHASQSLVRNHGMTSRKELMMLVKGANKLLKSGSVDTAGACAQVSPVAKYCIAWTLEKSKERTVRLHGIITVVLHEAEGLWDDIVEARKFRGERARHLRDWLSIVKGMTGEDVHEEMTNMAAFATEQLRQHQYHLVDGRFRYCHRP